LHFSIDEEKTVFLSQLIKTLTEQSSQEKEFQKISKQFQHSFLLRIFSSITISSRFQKRTLSKVLLVDSIQTQ